MTDYSKPGEALRCCIPNPPETCVGCTYNTDVGCNVARMMSDAADAIEALQAEVGQWKAAVKGQEDGIKVLQAEVERLEPKRGEWKVDMSHFSPHIVCSVCGVEIPCVAGWCMDAHMNYCPNCGAKMEVQDESVF